MNKNIILAIVLSVVILVIYNLFFLPKAVVPPATPEKEEMLSPPTGEEWEGEEEEVLLPSIEAQKFYLENTQIKLVFNSQGGIIESWYLKDKKKELIKAGDSALNMSLFLPDGEEINLRNEIFQSEVFQNEEEENNKIVFFWEDRDKKIKLTKIMELPEYGYQIQVSLSLDNFPLGAQYQLSWPIRIGEKMEGEERLAFWQNTLYEEFQKKEGGVRSEYDKRIKWMGVRKKKDEAVLMIPLAPPLKGIFQLDSWYTWGFKDNHSRSSWIIYAGPQSYGYLRLLNNQIKQIVGEDYQLNKVEKRSIWGQLSAGLQWLLLFFYGFTGNFGIAIILLTLLIYGALSPLTFKQFESMHKMQLIQPEIQAIQKKFKSDPKKLQMEIMKVYREHKVNPLSGCLPMIVQLPVIFILYRALLGFPFYENPSFLWIPDLSKPNIPLLLALGGMMFLQQRISQKLQAGSQQQAGMAKMMQFFPLFLIVILWSLPSGVMLYWFTSTSFSIVQQFLIRRKTSAARTTKKDITDNNG